MSVVGFREVLPRTFSHRFGEAPTAERRFVVTVTQPVPHQTIIDQIGIVHGSVHPEYAYLFCTEGTFTETDRHHVEATFRYELPQFDGQDPQRFETNPLARADVWSFSTGGAQIPAVRHYDGTGNATLKPLVNAANDLFEGVTSLEAEVRATISWNRVTFPADLAAAVTNCVNNATYLWGAAHTWFCQGISASPQSEVVNGLPIAYWSGTTELVYRASGHNLRLLHVGWNYLKTAGDYSPTSKTQVYVTTKGGEEVPASTPQPLNSNGTLKTSGDPDILTRRVFQEIDFATYFGVPPF
jgi:hypothetical protein